MSVSIGPGAIAFTRTPRVETSRASAFVRPITPALLAAVVHHLGAADLAELRGDVDDRAAAARQHSRDREARPEEDAAEVDGHHAVVLGDRQLLERELADDPRVVHEHVDAAELRLDAVDGGAHLRLVGHVAGDEERAAARRAHVGEHGLRHGGVEHVGDRDVRALRRVGARDRRADPAGAARDHRPLPLQPHEPVSRLARRAGVKRQPQGEGRGWIWPSSGPSSRSRAHARTCSAARSPLRRTRSARPGTRGRSAGRTTRTPSTPATG